MQMTAEISAGAAPHSPNDWHSINWKQVSEEVRRLQARIVSNEGGLGGKVKALQHLLTRSFSGMHLP